MLIRASFLALTVLASCTGSDPSREEIWRAREPDRYVVQTCRASNCLRAAVQDGAVLSLEERMAESEEWSSVGSNRNPLDDLWESAREETEGCDVKRLGYDDEFGYLSWYCTGCEGFIGPGESVVCFEPGTTELDRCDAPSGGIPLGCVLGG